MNYQTVIGLEIHAELLTASKIFCSCSTAFGSKPNTQICEVCIGLPGALPVLNEKAVRLAVTAGLALGCEITENCRFDRKNYFYPDLPKGYQISQLYLPICRNGHIEIDTDAGKKEIRIREIHMEEDAGKLIHGKNGETHIDYNRCGVPLIEIVTEPDFSSAEEAAAFLTELKKILLFTGVSDCKMEEGSLRADVNLSVKPENSEALGTRTEMKNLSSFRAVQKAIIYESERQIKELEHGNSIIQQTRRWDEDRNVSLPMRTKEEANDYKYFPEPDIPPLVLSKEYIEEIRKNIPELPSQKKERLIAEYGITEYEALVITDSPAMSEFYEKTAALSDPSQTAKWIIGEVSGMFAERGLSPENSRLIPSDLAEIINMVTLGKISRSTGRDVLAKVLDDKVKPSEYVEENGLLLIDSADELLPLIKDVIGKNEKAVLQYKNGKENALHYLLGQIMKATKGRAKINEVRDILKELLK